MIKRFGLLGFPLVHSFSPKYFKAKFKELDLDDHVYHAIPIASVEGFKYLPKDDLAGLNVTVPYKESIVQYLDEVVGEAKNIQAVNTIVVKDARLTGYNTDVYGFEQSLVPILDSEKKYSALVLGSGGASKAVRYVLDLLGISYKMVSRYPKGDAISYKSIDPELISQHHLIINTTPLGMAPRYKEKPNLPYHAISSDHILYDLVYNPEKTLFLKLGEEQGASIKNGFEMLELQAEKSWEIWNSK